MEEIPTGCPTAVGHVALVTKCLFFPVNQESLAVICAGFDVIPPPQTPLPISVLIASHEFDSEQIPDLTKDIYIQDIHCVGSLCKLYFRELPNPLLTYQLYEKFSVSMRQMWGTSPFSGASAGRAEKTWKLGLPLQEAGPAFHTLPSLSALRQSGFLEPSEGCITKIPSLTLCCPHSRFHPAIPEGAGSALGSEGPFLSPLGYSQVPLSPVPHCVGSACGAPAEGPWRNSHALQEFPSCLPFPRNGMRSK